MKTRYQALKLAKKIKGLYNFSENYSLKISHTEIIGWEIIIERKKQPSMFAIGFVKRILDIINYPEVSGCISLENNKLILSLS